jgi:hypothetical protein
VNATHTAVRPEGTTYNIKLDSGEVTPEGKKLWKAIGKCFIRNDGSGGAIYVGQGDNERRYSLFPKDRPPRPGPRPTREQAALAAL